MGILNRSSRLRKAFTAAATFAFLASSASVNAYQTQNLYVYFDAANTSSYNSAVNNSVWNDLSGNSRNGTISAPNSVTFSGGALNFPGGFDSSSNTSPHVVLGGDFSDFSTGITIEVEAHFGSNVGNWERIFDFGNGPQSDNIWLGRYTNSDEIAIEIWRTENSVQTNYGRCKTANSVNALATATFKKFALTLDGSRCSFYIDGVQVDTEVDGKLKPSAPYTFDTFYNDPSSLSSNDNVLPRTVARTNNYLGRSNWSSDAIFEGAVKYLRIYTTALSSQSITNNTNVTTPSNTITYATTGSTSGAAPGAFTGSGSVTLDATGGTLAKTGHSFAGWATTANQTVAISNSYTLSSDVTLYPVFQPVVVIPGTPGTPTATISNTTASLSWAAPSTGTAPFTYAVTSSPAGATCTISSVTASCTGLTSGTSYTFTVTASNSAGSSSASSASNSVLSSTPPVQQNTPAPPPSPTLQVISQIDSGSVPRPVPISVTPGKSQTLTGTNLDLVTTVRVGNITTSINKNLGSELNIQIPKSLPAGRYKVELLGAFGAISQENFLEVPKKTSVKIAAGFPVDSSRMSKLIRSKVAASIKTLDGAIRAVCVGSTSGTVATSAAKKLARARAEAACAHIKSLYPSITTSIQIDPASGIGTLARNTKINVYNY